MFQTTNQIGNMNTPSSEALPPDHWIVIDHVENRSLGEQGGEAAHGRIYNCNRNWDVQ